jgi:putative hemolysin
MNKRVVVSITCILLVASLSACTTLKGQPSEPGATENPPLNMPNPASVFCVENGFTLEIRTALDGSQSGVCVFTNGSECEEWAYFRGECAPAAQPDISTSDSTQATQKAESGGAGENASGGYMPPGSSEPLNDWWGVIKSTPPGTQYDDYFERQDLGGPINFGIDSLDPAVQAQVVALRDSGKIVHLYGTLFSNVPDYNGSQVQVDRLEVEE